MDKLSQQDRDELTRALNNADDGGDPAAAEKDRIVAGVQSLVNEIKGMDAEVGDACQNLLDEHVKMEGVTANQLRKLGGKFQARLNTIREEAATAVVTGGEYDDLDPPF